jgi:hypothetical protein
VRACACLLCFPCVQDVPEVKFFHDPGLGSDSAGQVRKELAVKRIGGGKPGYFFNFAVTAKGGDDTGVAAGQRKWSLAVSEGEFQVVLTLIRQTLPDLLALSTKPIVQREEGAEGEQQQTGSSSNSEGNSRQASSSSGFVGKKKWESK